MSLHSQGWRFALRSLKKTHYKSLAPSTPTTLCWLNVPGIKRFISPAAVSLRGRWVCRISAFLPLMMC